MWERGDVERVFLNPGASTSSSSSAAFQLIAGTHTPHKPAAKPCKKGRRFVRSGQPKVSKHPSFFLPTVFCLQLSISQNQTSVLYMVQTLSLHAWVLMSYSSYLQVREALRVPVNPRNSPPSLCYCPCCSFVVESAASAVPRQRQYMTIART